MSDYDSWSYVGVDAVELKDRLIIGYYRFSAFKDYAIIDRPWTYLASGRMR